MQEILPSKGSGQPLIDLLETVWTNANQAVTHSWGRLNHSMSQALELAVGSGFQIRPEDLSEMDKFRPGHWLGSDGLDPFYTLAVAVDNLCAARAIEEHLGRPPFIVDDVTTPAWGNPFLHANQATKRRGRVAVGSSFRWQGCYVKVTSIGTDSFVACAYDWASPPRSPTRRFTITRGDIRKDRAERKMAADAHH